MGGKSSQMAKNGQQPQSQMSKKGQPPQSQSPMRGQPPQSQIPMDGQPPQPQSQKPMGMPMSGPQYQMGMPMSGPQYQMGMPMSGPQYSMGMPMSGPQYPMGMPMGGPQYQMGPMPPANPIPIPDIIPGIPPGLEYLNFLDAVFVRQQLEVLEVISGRHTPNKYDLFNMQGELIFRAVEVADPIITMHQLSNRNFNIVIFDLWGRQVISLNRPYSFALSQQPLTVCAPPGNVAGIVIPVSTYCSSEFFVKQPNGQTILRIQGVGGMCVSNWGARGFQVLSIGGGVVGSIIKQYAGIVQEATTSADNFVVTFPKDLDIFAKATLVGATVLLDFIYFENAYGQNQRRGYHHGYGHRHHGYHHGGILL